MQFYVQLCISEPSVSLSLEMTVLLTVIVGRPLYSLELDNSECHMVTLQYLMQWSSLYKNVSYCSG